jgi:hypothetical protein
VAVPSVDAEPAGVLDATVMLLPLAAVMRASEQLKPVGVKPAQVKRLPTIPLP